jgi:hypothetical protein
MMVQYEARQGLNFNLPKFEWPLKSLQTKHTHINSNLPELKKNKKLK